MVDEGKLIGVCGNVVNGLVPEIVVLVIGVYGYCCAIFGVNAIAICPLF